MRGRVNVYLLEPEGHRLSYVGFKTVAAEPRQRREAPIRLGCGDTLFERRRRVGAPVNDTAGQTREWTEEVSVGGGGLLKHSPLNSHSLNRPGAPLYAVRQGYTQCPLQFNFLFLPLLSFLVYVWGRGGGVGGGGCRALICRMRKRWEIKTHTGDERLSICISLD